MKRILLFIISLGKGKRTSTLRKPDFASCFPFSSCIASRNWWKTPERKGDNTLVPTQSKTPLLTIPRYILECRPKLQKPPNQTLCSPIFNSNTGISFSFRTPFPVNTQLTAEHSMYTSLGRLSSEQQCSPISAHAHHQPYLQLGTLLQAGDYWILWLDPGKVSRDLIILFIDLM